MFSFLQSQLDTRGQKHLRQQLFILQCDFPFSCERTSKVSAWGDCWFCLATTKQKGIRHFSNLSIPSHFNLHQFARTEYKDYAQIKHLCCSEHKWDQQVTALLPIWPASSFLRAHEIAFSYTIYRNLNTIFDRSLYSIDSLPLYLRVWMHCTGLGTDQIIKNTQT